MLRLLVNVFFVLALASAEAQAAALALVRDPAFESEGAAGRFDAWVDCGTVPAVLEHDVVPHGQRYAVQLGSPGGGEIAGDASVCQQVVVPMARRVYLDYWARATSNEADAKHAFQWVGFFDGTTVPDMTTPYMLLVHDVVNTDGWQHFTFDITQLEGQKLYLSFGVHGDGNPSAHTSFVIGNVTLQTEAPLKTNE